MNLSDILWLISEVPANQREHMGIQVDDMKAYHVTTKDNAKNIKENGFKMSSSRQSYDRPEAVYFFLELSEINDDTRKILFDNPADTEIIEVIIPRDEFLQKSKWDGLFNVQFDYRSAIQFFGDVPKEWII